MGVTSKEEKDERRMLMSLGFKRRIHWAAHPDRCLKLVPPHAPQPAYVALSDCSQQVDNEFVLPTASGTIRPHAFPELCLDVPGGSTLQFWNCSYFAKAS